MDHQISTAQNDEKALAYWGVLGTVIWGLVIAAIFITLQVITMIAAALKGEHNLSEKQFQDILISSQENGVIISVSTFVTTILCCALVAVIIKLKRGSSLTSYLAIRTVPLKTFLIWLGFLAVFLAASDTLTVFLGRPIVPPFVATIYASTHPVWLIWVALIVAAPLFEETFFRGFLFKGLASSSIGSVGAIVLTAALWAIIHAQYDAYNIAIIFCLGLIFGMARMQTGSLLVPLAMHAFANFGSTAEAAFLG
jgi:membrane protease YdiL (CAAX protease family)